MGAFFSRHRNFLNIKGFEHLSRVFDDPINGMFAQSLADGKLGKVLSPLEEKILEDLVEALKGVALEVRVFGSRAQRKSTEDSDLDVLVLVPDDDDPDRVLQLARERLDWEDTTYVNLVVLRKRNLGQDPVFQKEAEKGFVIWRRT